VEKKQSKEFYLNIINLTIRVQIIEDLINLRPRIPNVRLLQISIKMLKEDDRPVTIIDDQKLYHLIDFKLTSFERFWTLDLTYFTVLQNYCH
jgi:hypothetical protein